MYWRVELDRDGGESGLGSSSTAPTNLLQRLASSGAAAKAP